jgi:hypothetical protein
MKNTMQIRSYLSLALFMLQVVICTAQIGVNTTNPQGSLDINSATDGLLVPRVALVATDVATIVTPTESEIVYNTFTSAPGANQVTPGFYYWNGSLWIRLATGANSDWSTIGNTGTTAGTNFIGTTDNQAFVVKTNGSAATNERLRFLPTGPAVFNNVTPFAGDVFSVYGTGYTSSINALGNFAINGYVGANGVGLYGESTSAAANNGIGVFGSLIGTSTASGNISYGVSGRNSTTPSGTGIAIGTGGDAVSTSGDARGLNGVSSSPNGIGVAGFNTATTGNGYGIYGQTSSVAGVGVFGINAANAYSTNTAVGVFGRATGSVTTGFSIGVRGYSDATTGNGYAFYGQALSNAATGGITFVNSSGAGWQGQNAGTGEGVRGFNTNATVATAGSGVYGQTGGSNAMGGEFTNTNATNGTGIFGIGNNVAGTFLVNGSGGAFSGATVGTFSKATTIVGGTGVLAVGNNAPNFTVARGSGIAATGTQFGVVGFASTMVNTNGTVSNAAALGANASAGGYFEVQNAGAAQGWAYVGSREVAGAGGLRKIIGTGTVNTIVKDLNNNYVALSCPESPENLFQDFGQGKLINGKAHIEIDPIFSKNIVVNEKHPLRVFIQLEGDCEGVFVTNKTQNGFDVIELKRGTSNVPFTYTISANRADEVLPDGSISRYSEERFAPAPGPQEKSRAESISKPTRQDVIQNPITENGDASVIKIAMPQKKEIKKQ